MTNVIRTEGLTEEELALAQFMQGTLNRGARRVYIGAKYYMDYLSDEHEFCSVWELLEETSGEFEGLAVYDYAPGDESINLAADGPVRPPDFWGFRALSWHESENTDCR